jgi:hypothetical protein
MVATAATSARPPKKSPPGDRDREIFQLAEIHDWTHDKIAGEKGLTRRRVSQIVQEVRHSLANHPADDPALATDIQRQRCARAIERLRLEDIIARAVRGLDAAPPALATTRTTGDGATTRTLRDQPPVDVRLLRMYLRAVTALGKLDERPELPAPPPDIQGQPWLEPRIQEVVKAWQGTATSYILTEAALSKFAEELTLAFLGCLNPPEALADEPPAFPSASHASPPETTDPAPFSTATGNATYFPAKSSTDDSLQPSAANYAATTAEKTDQGSVSPDYAKPLHIGPMPLPTARRQPVTELSVTPDQPGIATRRINPPDATGGVPSRPTDTQFDMKTPSPTLNPAPP